MEHVSPRPFGPTITMSAPPDIAARPGQVSWMNHTIERPEDCSVRGCPPASARAAEASRWTPSWRGERADWPVLGVIELHDLCLELARNHRHNLPPAVGLS
jgi:hypothetical protein